MAGYLSSMPSMFSTMPSTGFSQGGNTQWIVTPQEQMNYDSQFDKMLPSNGFIRGDQARNFFLQSNLPPPVLAQIWELADMTGDGKMDKLEFSIAMKLIKLKLQGVVLPASLPASMKQQPSVGGPGFGRMNTTSASYSMSNGSAMMASSQTAISSTSATGNLSRTNSISDSSSTRSNTEWSVPKQSKLKYNQLFNSNDRFKTGYLSSMQARHVLNNTGLAQMILAKIWQLSDIDNDGKLSQDEFVLAMHLCDSAKAGNSLPTTLPLHLIPPSYRSAAPPVQTPGQLGLLVPLTQMDPNNKVASANETGSVFTTFEDKRRDNFQKGNLELEKRRLALLEIQQKEKERLEQKEREEREKREKERMDQERKRQEELERQLERQREAEREKEEQRRKAIEQKEAAQREMERQRQLEWERIRRKELLQHKLRDQELVVSLRAKTKTLDVELSSQQEKRSQLEMRVKDVQARLKEQTGQLNEMNRQRELKHSLVQKQQDQFELLNQQLNSLVPEKQNLNEKIQFKGNSNEDKNLQLCQREYQSKVFTMQRLRTDLEQTLSLKSSQAEELEKLNTELNHLRDELNKKKLSMENMNRIQQDKLRRLQEARRQKDIRKVSIDDAKKQQEKLASIAAAQKLENDRRKGEEANKRRMEEERRLQIQKIEAERAKAAEAERIRLQDEARKKAEEEAKKAEMKRKILEMQQERLKQKQQQQKVSVVTDGSSKPQQGRGFELVLSKDPSKLVKYQALYNFIARNPDELSVNVDDIIIVDTSQDAEPDWLAGSKNNKAGWFPANYVERIPGPAIQPPPQSAKPTKNAEPHTAQAAFSIGQQSSAFSAAQKSQTQSQTEIKPPQMGLRYRAIYPWIAKKDNHLTFDKDDIIAVSEKEEMWWFGHCKGKTGWFPKSYVKETTSTTPIGSQRPSSPKTSPNLKRKAPEPPGGKSAAAKYQASYAFAGTEEGDLSFNVDDIISVTDADGEWWTGTLNGKTGIFPANYVAPYKVPTQQQTKTTSLSKPEVATVIAAYQATSREQLSLDVGQMVSVRKKNENGWWEGELQARGKKRQIGWFPANYVKLKTAASSIGKATSVDKTKLQTPSVYRVVAMYDYSAQNIDELSFQRGDSITVDDKTDPDWWKGTIGSSTGLFPSNYVQDAPGNK